MASLLLKKIFITPCTTINKLVLNYLKSPKFFSIGFLLAGGIDASVLLIMMVLVAIITFLAGIAYGIYLNDKMSTKKANNQLTEG